MFLELFEDWTAGVKGIKGKGIDKPTVLRLHPVQQSKSRREFALMFGFIVLALVHA